jgi:hypothetical protein
MLLSIRLVQAIATVTAESSVGKKVSYRGTSLCLLPARCSYTKSNCFVRGSVIGSDKYVMMGHK